MPSLLLHPKSDDADATASEKHSVRPLEIVLLQQASADKPAALSTMSLRQSLQQKMLQKLSPQQIQLMKLFQIPTAQLEERIKEELEENPALELADEGHEEADTAEDPYINESTDEQTNDEEPKELDMETIDLSDYLPEGDEDIADYKLRDDHYADDDEDRTRPHRVETSFNELMLQQLGMLSLDDTDRRIAEQIVGSLDDDGYLRREVTAIQDDLAFRQNIDASEEQINALIDQIQQFDPAGVCARDLRECLLLQLKRTDTVRTDVQLAYRIISKYFDEFTKKHYEKIQRSLGIDDDTLKAAIQVIVRLNPRPGFVAETSSGGENYITPDFFILNNAGNLELTLNSRNAPDLRVSEHYRDMLVDYDKGSKKDKRQKEAVLFIKQKLDAAKWFIDAIKQRQHTLLSTMGAILQYQHAFFLSGDETDLKPMILKDIAEKTGLDISTVSRVANSKFVQTEYGTYRLKFFFSESMQTESGEEVSTREVKKILSEMLDQEDKKNPLSDEKLTDMLTERGYNIARRTVAKYREQLNVPVARLRKKL
ncbi:MAG: RNA polymerase factor sigma-54 [Ferruginibacter sp.]